MPQPPLSTIKKKEKPKNENGFLLAYILNFP
jgi:hypothetical protein